MASHSRIRQAVKMKVESKEKTIKERNQSNGYGSSFVVLYILKKEYIFFMYLVAQGGLEPPTRGFSVHCYYQLSYRAIGSKYKTHKEKIVGIEPTTHCLTDNCSTK